MAWLQIDWALHIPDPEENHRGGDPTKDEPSLQFALVTAFSGAVRVHGYSTGNLFQSGGFGVGVIGWPGNVPTGSINSKNVPTVRNPFLGLVVRAVEQDSSNNRDADNKDFYTAVHDAAQLTFDAGGVPTADILWTAGNSARLRDRWLRDDDDFVGVSARAYPEFGRTIARQLDQESALRPGGVVIPGTEEDFEFAFVARSATEYQLQGQVRAVTNDPDQPRLAGTQDFSY